MDVSEIEEVYKKDLEDAQKIFLDGIKAKSDSKKLELEYKNNLKKARTNYEKLMKKNIKKEKKLATKPKKSKNKKEKKGIFKVDTTEYELNAFQRFRYGFGLKWFKFWFYLRNFRRKITPEFMSFRYAKVKVRIRIINNRIIRIYEKIKENVKIFAIKIAEYSKALSKQVNEKVKEIKSKILAKITGKKKKEGESEEKKEGEGKSSGDNPAHPPEGEAGEKD